MAGNPPLFRLMEDELDSTLTRMFDEMVKEGRSLDEVEAKYEEVLPGRLTAAAAVLSEGLKRNAKETLSDRGSLRSRFGRRLQKKWGRPLGLLGLLLEVIRECGEEFNQEHRPDAAARNDL